jgi:hypothetical protein
MPFLIVMRKTKHGILICYLREVTANKATLYYVSVTLTMWHLLSAKVSTRLAADSGHGV